MMTTGNDIDPGLYPEFRGYLMDLVTDLDAVYNQELNVSVKASRMSDIMNKHQKVWDELQVCPLTLQYGLWSTNET